MLTFWTSAVSQQRLPDQISLLMVVALAIGGTCVPGQPRSSDPSLPIPGAARAPVRDEPPPLAPARPYKPVPVVLPHPASDPSFEAFRKELGEIASRKDRGALASKVVAKGFFWMGDKGDKANQRKSGIENLAAAVGLDSQDGAGWEILADAAEEATLEALPARKGVMCGPAAPVFNHKAAEQIRKATGTELVDWGFPVKGALDVHATRQASSPVIEKVGSVLVRILPEGPLPGAGDAPMLPPGSYFVRIVTPSGVVGFVKDDTIRALDYDRLCFIKEPAGWRIIGYIDE